MSDSARPLPLSTFALGNPAEPKTTQLPIERLVCEPPATERASAVFPDCPSAAYVRDVYSLNRVVLSKPTEPKTTQLPIERFVYEPLSTDTFSVALNGAVAAFLARLDLLEPTEAREEFCRAFRVVAFFVDKRDIGHVELRVQASPHISDNRLHEAPIYFTQRMTAEKMAAAVETAYDMLTAALDIYSSVFLFVRPAFVHPSQIKADECVYIAFKTVKSSYDATAGWWQFLTARSRVLHRETLALAAQFPSNAAPTPPADEPPLDVPAPPSRARRLRQYLIALFSCAPCGWTRL